MAQMATTRVRKEWVDSLIRQHGTLTRIAEILGADKSTTSRWLRGVGEASPRFIGAALTAFPIQFDEAFVCVVEEVEQRRARIIRRPTGRPAVGWGPE